MKDERFIKYDINSQGNGGGRNDNPLQGFQNYMVSDAINKYVEKNGIDTSVLNSNNLSSTNPNASRVTSVPRPSTVNPNASVAAPKPAYVNPNASAAPKPAYVNPNASASTPKPAYVNPNASASTPKPAYVNPNSSSTPSNVNPNTSKAVVVQKPISTVASTVNNDKYSSLSDIYVNYSEMDKFYKSLVDASSNIKSDIKKVNDLLSDLNSNWKGTLPTKYINKLKEYMNNISEYSDFYEKMSGELKQSGKAYKDFDSFFENEII